MRKIFTTLKSVVSALVIAAMALSVSCSYDDTAINNRVDKVEKDLAALTERVANLESKLQTEVDALEDLINGKVVIVDVVVGEDGKTTIKLSDGKTITVVNECKYVACDHECVPCDHECTPCDCDTLKYRVVEGVLEVSADGETWVPVNPQENPCDCDNLLYRVVEGVLEVSADGETWVAINGVAGDQVVVDVVLNEDGTATIELATGEKFTTIKAELIECEAARTGVYVLAGGSRDIAFSVNDAVVDINVMNQPFGWSASVEEAAEAPEAGDEGGIAPMPLAAGGKNYVLTINGPAASLKEAAKEGVVSVHFNTAAGACKVLSIDVNLAELTLEVDGSGNITLTNTLAESAGVDEMGNPMFDFVDFYIGIVDAADYATYGDRVFAETFDDWTYEYTANVASTQRTTGFQNIVDLQWYEDGVCEKESYTLTVDQLAGAFWPKYTFELGKEYIIFATTETEMAGYVEQPILTNAAKDSYRRVSVQAKIVEDSIAWNDATVELNLAGFDWFVVGWVPVADLQDVVDNGAAENLDSALEAYINAYSVMSAGAIIEGINDTVQLSELAQLSMTGWAPMLNANTEYKFFVYAFNAQTEMELYMHQFNAANLYNFGTFRTAALELGNFDAKAKFEVLALEEKNVEISATFGEDVKTVAYNWLETSYIDPEEAAEFILGDIYYTEYVTFDEYTTSVYATKYYYYGVPETLYLGVLAINAAGEYVYIEFDPRAEQGEGGGDEPVEPEEPAYLSIDKINWVSAKAVVGDSYNPTSIEFKGEGGYTLTLAGYFDFEDPAQPFFNGSWWLDYSYSNSFNVYYSYVTYPDQTLIRFVDNGWVSISEYEGQYWVYFSDVKLNDIDATYTFGIACDIEGLILPSEYKLPEGVFVPVRAEAEGLGDGDSNWKGWFYDEAGNCLAVVGFWDVDAAAYGATGQYIPVNGEPVEITVTKTQNPIANGSSHYYFNFEATWEGGSVKMEALSLPTTIKGAEEIVGDFEFAQSGVNFGGGYADLYFKDANGGMYGVSLNHASMSSANPVIPSGTYVWTEESYDDFTIYGVACYCSCDDVVVVNNGDGTYDITIHNIEGKGINGHFSGAFGDLRW